ncbi:MAG TPA: cyanophycin synthetase [Candidatus Limnocylindria bacterium]|nr:cyanophycin synthetase [Candidatus Limnocylindria bacterium]
MDARIRILRKRVLHGPNVWSRLPVVRLVVDIGALEQLPSNMIPGFADRLLESLPGLGLHTCGTGRPGGFAGRLAEGTWVGHIVEHVALELQRAAGGSATRGKTRAAEQPGTYDVIFAFDLEAVGLLAADAAVELVNDLIAGGPPGREAVERIVGELRIAAQHGQLGLSTQAITDVARRRHIPWTRLNARNLVQLGWGVHARRIRATVTSGTSLIGAEMARDKDDAAAALERAGIPTPTWRLATTAEEAAAHARLLGYPVVVKPVDGHHGRGVRLDVKDEAEVVAAYEAAISAGRRRQAIVQRQVSGRDYRVLVIGGRMVACAERVPAGVVGDGRLTVAQLIERENADPRRGEGHARELTRIRLDGAAEALLGTQGLIWQSIPGAGRRVSLSSTANLSTGGTSIDRTDEVHPEVIGMAELAARVVELDVAGIDIVTTDIGRPLHETGGAIIEINAGPGFRMHTRPTVGRGRNVGGAVLDHLFGPGSEGRIPVAAVTGSNGKTTTVRLLAHILTTAGLATGMTTTENIVANGLQLKVGDMAGPASARLLLATPTIEAAVLEVARGGILRDGLGYDYNDVAIVTNVTGDHLGLDGITTIERLAAVKAVIVDAVPRTGTAVLNADDPLVLAMAPRCNGAVALTTVASGDLPGRQAVDRHLANGGLGGRVEAGVDGEAVVVHRGGAVIVGVPLREIPITLEGAARMHVANALAAATGAAALGVRGEAIAEGLRSFAASPGRVERHLIEGREVILDYGHNIAALRALAELIERIADGRRVIGVVSMPGDRRDEDRVAFGALAGTLFDRLFVAEPAVRGRPTGEAAGLLIEAAAHDDHGSPSRAGHPSFVPDEADATRAAFAASEPGDLIVLCVASGSRVLAGIGG